MCCSPVPAPPPADRIPARTDSAARSRYKRFLQLSLSAVDGHAQWITAPVPGKPAEHNAITKPDWLCFEGADEILELRATQRFCYVDDPKHPGERKVQTADYGYTIRDAEGRELFSWQWHPSLGEFDMPHIHIGRGVPGDWGKLHVPTGRVAFEDVLLFLIRDYGVRPVREDGREVITESLRRFRSFRSWA